MFFRSHQRHESKKRVAGLVDNASILLAPNSDMHAAKEKSAAVSSSSQSVQTSKLTIILSSLYSTCICSGKQL